MAAAHAQLQANVGNCCTFTEMRNQVDAAGNPFLGPFTGTNYKITGISTALSMTPNDYRYVLVPNQGAGPGQEIIRPMHVTSIYPCAAAAAAPPTSQQLPAPAAAMSGGRKRKARKTRKGRKASKRRRTHK